MFTGETFSYIKYSWDSLTKKSTTFYPGICRHRFLERVCRLPPSTRSLSCTAAQVRLSIWRPKRNRSLIGKGPTPVMRTSKQILTISQAYWTTPRLSRTRTKPITAGPWSATAKKSRSIWARKCSKSVIGTCRTWRSGSYIQCQKRILQWDQK